MAEVVGSLKSRLSVFLGSPFTLLGEGRVFGLSINTSRVSSLYNFSSLIKPGLAVCRAAA